MNIEYFIGLNLLTECRDIFQLISIVSSSNELQLLGIITEQHTSLNVRMQSFLSN
jgi:hypothetical protein